MVGLSSRLGRSGARRPRFIPQMEAAECGAACLAMVLDAHGSSVLLSQVRDACITGRDGVSAAKICRAAVTFGLEARAFRAEPAALVDLELPAILHWEFNHFVVLESVGRRTFNVVDPALGRRRISPDVFSAAFTGVALSFTPGAGFRRVRRRSPSLSRYWKLLKRLRPAWMAIVGSTLLLEVLGLAFPAANQVLVDHVLLAQRESWAIALLSLLGACTLSVVVVSAVRERVLRRVHFALDLALMVDFARHLVKLPLAFFQQRTSGDLLQRIIAQTELREALLNGVSGTFDAVLLLSYAAMMLAYSSRIGVMIIGMALARIALVLLLRPQIVNATAAHLAERAKEYQALLEPLAVPELVRALGGEHIAEQRHHGRAAARLNAELERDMLTQGGRELSSVLEGVAQAFTILLGGRAVLDHEITLGTFTGLLTLQGLFGQPLSSLVDAIAVSLRARSVLARIDDVLEVSCGLRDARSLESARGRIELRNVSFRHAGDGPILCNELNLRIEAGEKIAIVGRVGQGKSTLLRLITGLLAPSRGTVLLDGVPVHELTAESLSRVLGVVLQEPFFFDDSVRANLSLNWPEAPEEALLRAIELACATDVVAALPQGLDTVVGDNGSRLSGGERQRLALARAVVVDPKVLVLDEATSSLDLATEAVVHANLARLGCTRIVVAHRMDTVRDADRILVFDEGRVVEEGTYERLRQRPGLFADLLDDYVRGAA